MSLRYAVIGNPIAHSLSPVIHQMFALQTGIDLRYEAMLVAPSQFELSVHTFFREGARGLNITLPFKTRACAMGEQVSERCFEAGAANTLWMQEGRLYADNTDGVGLLRDLSRYVNVAGKRVLLLGAGGAARGVLGPLLLAEPLELTLVNRTLKTAHVLQKIFTKIKVCCFEDLPSLLETTAYDVVINATAASLEGQSLPLPVALFRAKPFCYDLAYSTTEPLVFVTDAQRFGCLATDGLGMLVEQAAEAFFIWHGVLPETQSVLAGVRHSRLSSW